MNRIPGSEVASSKQKSPRVNEWLKLARDADQRSTNYFDNNYRKTWENDLRMFQSRHPVDSKYNTDAYKFRSRGFRPKSRSVVRKLEATAALAFFSNPDVISVAPEDEESMEQIASSEVMKELLQYRLTKSVPWFLTVIGGFQDAMNVGLVCSLQYWDYQAVTTQVEVTGFHPLMGQITAKIPQTTVKVDKPCIELFPVENVRFDPAAKWFDVVGTSPYLILHMPMYVTDVLDRMETGSDEYKWRTLPEKTILNARITDFDSLQQTRTNVTENPAGQSSDVNEFDVVMVHLNFIRSGSETYAYYTLKTDELLSDPVTVEKMFKHCHDGRPPVQIGFCVVETHKPAPSSLIGLTSELQKETNEISNQRRDNVKYVLNKRNLVRRGSNVDVEGLVRNVPGGVTMVNDVEKDIREVNWPDVTASSFEEQNIINMDFDDLAGNFGQGSVLTNRKLNETVGGMRLMAQGANIISEYTIQVFVHTWVEPVLRQIARMEQAYETNEVILALAARKAKLFQRFGTTAVLDHLLAQDLTLSVAVGMGATDPDERFKKFMQASLAYAQISQIAQPDMNLPEIRKTLYGLAGVKDAAKFFTQVDPRMAKAHQMMQMAEAKAKEVVDGSKQQLLQREVALNKREADLNMQEFMVKAQSGMEHATNQMTARSAGAKIAVQAVEAQSAVKDNINALKLTGQNIVHKIEKAKQKPAPGNGQAR